MMRGALGAALQGMRMNLADERRGGELAMAAAIQAKLEADLKAGRRNGALKQLQMIMARMMRGALGAALQGMRMNLAEDNLFEVAYQVAHRKVAEEVLTLKG